MADFPMVYGWKNNPIRAALYGRRCRVLCSGRMYSSLIEFENGEQVVTSRRAVRTAESEPAAFERAASVAATAAASEGGQR